MRGDTPIHFELPQRGAFQPNNDVDPLKYYHHPIVGRLFRARIDTGLALLRRKRFRRLLEVGYGSGILIPTLTQVTSEYWGVDRESAPASAVDALEHGGGSSVQLVMADMRSMPFTDKFFDSVVAFSVLEHLEHHALELALAEIARVLEPGGTLLVGCPAVHRAMNAAFSAIGFRNIEHHHFSSINDVLDASAPWFDCEALRTLPRIPLPLGWAPYTAVRLRRHA